MAWQDLKDQIERLIKSANVVLRILFPSKRRLCDQVFFGFSTDTLFSDQYCLVLRNEAITILKRSGEAILGILMELENLIRRYKAHRHLGIYRHTELAGATARTRENTVAAPLNLVRSGGDKGRKDVREARLKVIEDIAENGSEKGMMKALQLLKFLVECDNLKGFKRVRDTRFDCLFNQST